MKFNSRFITMISVACSLIIGAGAAIMTTPKAPHLRPVIPASGISDSSQNDNFLPQETTSQILRPYTQHARIDEPSPSVSEIQTPCIGPCLKAVAVLINSDQIDDESYSRLSRLLAEFAAHLKTDSNARLDMIELAKTTEDGNKRAFIIDAFSMLPSDQRIELGHALSSANDWQIRANGITVLSSSEILTPDGAKALIRMYGNEQNTHVKRAMLKGLNNPAVLRGDQATLGYLSGVMLSETNSSVKSEAMLTNLALQEDPFTAMPDVFYALNSEDAEFQYSAFIALERIYEANDLGEGGGDRIDHEAVKTALENFMEIEITPENASAMDRLLKEADMFYERHLKDK